MVDFLCGHIQALDPVGDTCQGLEAWCHTIFCVPDAKTGYFDLVFKTAFFVGQVAPLIRAVPFIVRLIPQLVKTTFYRGSVVVANKVDPATDEELARNLNRKIDNRSKDKDKDNQMVIKVSDAIACIEKRFNETTLIAEFVLVAVKSLIEGSQARACGQKLFDKMAQCIREDALRQDTPRVKNVTIKLHRPAKGHGKGRKGF